MLAKHKVESLVEQYAQDMKDKLGIRHKVNFHVVSGKTKKYQKLKISNADNMGLSLIAIDGSADVFIFYDKHSSEREAASTIFHELLHVRVGKLSGLVTLNCTKAYNVEERLVRDLEELYISVWWPK